MRLIVIAGLLLTSGCASYRKEYAQEAVNKAVPACRDGVEYLVLDAGTNFQAIAPHLRTDGLPYTCGGAQRELPPLN